MAPLSDKRTLEQEKKKVEKTVSVPEDKLNDLIGKVEEMKLNPSDSVYGYLEDFSSETNEVLKCNFCPGLYKKRGFLKTHLEEKHGKKVVLRCNFCGFEDFEDQKKLTRHMKTCT